MKKNPFLKAEERVLRKVYGNKATLTYHVKTRSYNSDTGAMTETDKVFPREIWISGPSEYADALIDGENIKKGDLRCEVARKTLIDALRPVTGDPGVLSELRSASAMTGGIETSTDRLTFCGRLYSIRKIQGADVYANEPTKYKLQLREVK